ncbi:MAG: amidohydrolase family protein [Rhodobacteraceae bacterium]|nr:amidohydrolase family protein [Paracoccaceae bacterium]
MAEPGFDALLGLVADGAVWVKISGCFRFCDAPCEKADADFAAHATANPERCFWGSEWPYLTMADAETPDPGKLSDALFRAMPDEAFRHRIMVDNPAELYGFARQLDLECDFAPARGNGTKSPEYPSGSKPLCHGVLNRLMSARSPSLSPPA